MKTLRQHQKDVIREIIASWKQGHVPYADCCVAFGKSLVLAHLSKMAMDKGKRALQLVPNKELCEQNYLETTDYIRSTGIGIVSASLNRFQFRKNCIVGTYQTVKNRIDMIGKIDMLLIDEADIVSPKAETSIRQIVDHLQSVNPKMLIAGVTGSPYRLDQGALHHDTPDGPAMFTTCCYTSDIHYMIEHGYWAKPVYLEESVHVDVEGIPLSGRDYNADIMGVKFHAIVKDAVMDMKAKFIANDIETAIIFASNIANAEEIVKLWGRSNMRILHGGMSKREREKTLEWLKNGTGNRYIVNVGILIRGFNYPALQCVVYFTATKSLAKYVQVGGRAARPANGKAVFFVIDYGTNVERHGRLEVIEAPEKPKRRGDAPKKSCLLCYEPNVLSAKRCVKCGAEFISDNEDGLYSMRSKDEPVIDEYEVEQVFFDTKYSKSGQIMLVIQYCGFDVKPFFNQYVLLNHSGTAKMIADSQIKPWFKRTEDYYKIGSVGRTVENMYKLLVNNPEFFNVPERIWLSKKPGERFKQLKKIQFR